MVQLKNKKLLGAALIVVALVAAAGIAFAGPRAAAQCRDGIDNDGDTFADYPADTGCSSKNDNSELGVLQCDNGVNDDNDGLVDYPDDPGCVSPFDESELGSVACDDNVDNDLNALIDYPADPGCSSASDTSEFTQQVNTCSDSDGGFVVTTQGTVNGTTNGVSFTYTDECFSTWLREWYCAGTQQNNMFPANDTYNCASVGNFTSCVNGACVP